MGLFVVPTLASRVRRLRNSLEMNQKDLADEVKVSQQAIQKIESGETKKPQCINALATSLRVSVDYLETGAASASRDDPTMHAESYMLTAKDAMAESIASMKAINLRNGKNKNELDESLLLQAFEISLRAKLTGDYLTAALGFKNIKKVK